MESPTDLFEAQWWEYVKAVESIGYKLQVRYLFGGFHLGESYPHSVPPSGSRIAQKFSLLC
ncbi:MULTISPECIES: hypothetical protein [Nostoc]|uniref:hypothetical protein n=1 Tax=Nostoc TaxID=1177 RepID=UPI0016896C48|nr:MULTISPECIES: hypothetical protein [Nostoc]